MNKWTTWQAHKQKIFNFSQSVGKINEKMPNNFGKDILKTEKFFQLSFPKYPTFPYFSEQMNPLTDTQTENPNFLLANLWDRSIARCPQILIKICWKLSDFSNFLPEGGREGVSEHPKVLSSATGQRPVAELKTQIRAPAPTQAQTLQVKCFRTSPY